MKKEMGWGGGAKAPDSFSPFSCLRFLPSGKITCILLLFVCATLLNLVQVASARSDDSLFIVQSFQDLPRQKFSHLTVDKNTGTVYVGGINRLYQFDQELKLVQEVLTGPVNDSIECSSSGCTAKDAYKMQLTDNHNKLLVIDYTRSRLLVCGTVRQGSCQVRDLREISKLTRNVSEPIVTNNASASTVAFIAPGPPNPLVTHVLYIGVTYLMKAGYSDEVPAVASRSLDDDRFFDYASSDMIRSTRIYINRGHRENYPITYVYGFGSERFSYFLTRQKQDTADGSPYISKLVRVCQNDSSYYSYTEIPVECKDTTGKRYNLAQAAYVGKPGTDLATQLGIQTNDDVLFVVFSPSDSRYGEDLSKPANESALCVYAMTSVRRMFTTNIQDCFRGEGYLGLHYISSSSKCVSTRINDLGDDFCGMDLNNPLGGKQPVEGVAVLTFPVRLTSVATTSTEVYTVVFLGTATGHLKKVVIENQKNALEYGDITVDEGSPVAQDMAFDKTGDFLYVMTKNKVLKVKAQECSIYEGCNQCLGARDPYCGWCSLENKCSLRRGCRDATQDPQHWVSYKTGRCTSITSVSPNKLQRTTARTLALSIENLPSVEGSLICVFSAMGKDLTTDAKRTASGVSCTTPRNDMLPDIPQNEHHFDVTLSVRKVKGPEFVSTNFTFFDCNTYSSCTECVSSDYPCDWCVDGHRCTHDAAENCRNDVLVNGVNRVGPSIRSGKSFCPKITFVDSKEISVSSGTQKMIKVKVENIAQFITQTSFVCQFNIEGRVTSVKAQLLSDTIYCDSMEFSYLTKTESTNATFAVIWGGSKPLDNPDNIHVLVYQCKQMADNCGMCLSLPERYRCGWCQSTKTCEVQEQCSGQSWLDRAETCPNIVITDFYPRSGPWDGGTQVTIEGINLGKNFSDIYDGITVAGIACQPYRESYVKTKKVTCKVDSPGVNDFKEGTIIVKVAKQYRGESTEKYQFVSPVLTGLSPLSGPKSGGTLLNIQGIHMNAGSNITAFINGISCIIKHVSNLSATCETTESNSLLDRGKVEMFFDHGRRELNDVFFSYVQDPLITQVRTGMAGLAGVRSGARGIPSGGIIITVDGENFDVIRQPRMYVSYRGENFESEPCNVLNSTRMICRSSPITVDQKENLNSESGMEMDFGFVMDNVRRVRNLMSESHLGGFKLFPNPVYKRFEEDDNVKMYKADYLTINGENLDRAAQSIDVKVHIGQEACKVTSLSRSQLTCKPPQDMPDPLPGDSLARVIVSTGGQLNYTIGFLDYRGSGEMGSLPKQLIIGLSVGAVVLILILVVCLIVYQRKSNQNSRVLKSMQEQMDVLELRVAAECKEAFAELQTEMTDLTSELLGGGIPFLEYRTYAIKILFPNLDEMAVLCMDRPELLRKEKGLKLFGKLVMDKTFLLLFIRTLESNRYFSMRDRVNVASLIMVVLQGRMEYCTDILKTLLAELIEKCIEGKIHPKLLFRRTESVAEKMLSSWFTFLLFKFLKECAGEPLYLLYRAIKQQVDKGPVDAVSSEARYSLSEEKLIRQSIEYKEMTVEVSMCQLYMGGMDGSEVTGATPVKVLDCDTISQVKEKSIDAIYRYYPSSQRPRREELDLEWRTGASGRLILYDEDTTTRPEGGWKKLNTLAHYSVNELAQLTLIPKQASIYNYMSILPEKDHKPTHKYETLNLSSKYSSASPPLSRATSPLNHEDSGTKIGPKVWHLVRQQESDQREGERTNKMVSEIYLTRLLSTKLTLQKFVDDLFETIFSTAHRGSALPLAIKYMFDFLDDQALQHGITDPEVVHTWKSNSLPLRFWVNLIKNPNFVFDIHKSNIVDACLSVVAQTFMDSCSTSEHRLGKDSPSSKLLYAKDIPIYKEWVERYYGDIKTMQPISDQDMNAMLAEESRMHATEFNSLSALTELYNYAFKYSDQLVLALEEDEFSTKNRLPYKLEQVHSIMSSEVE